MTTRRSLLISVGMAWLMANHAMAADPDLGSKGLAGTGVTNVDITGSRVDAVIDLAGGVEGDVIIEFAQSSGLNADSIGITASLATAVSPSLLQRLPSATLTAVPVAFPVIITVEPPVDQGLSFNGAYTIDIHTELLEFTDGSPFRLFRAPLGGLFEDITESVLPGSIRTRGRRGSFSEFIIISDLRPVDTVIDVKFDKLDARIQNASLPPQITADLLSLSALARSKVDAGLSSDALDAMQEFVYRVDEEAGTGIPDIWRAARDLDNVAGDLVGAASSLQFSISLLP